MNKGPNQPGHRGGGHRRRRRHGGSQGSQQHHQQGGSGGKRGGRGQRGAAFVGPMDHSYRNAQNGNTGGQFRRGGFTPQFFQHPDVEPLPAREDASTRIFAFVDDLFFQTKIKDTARKLNVNVEFVKTEKDVFERVEQNGNGSPSLVILDLNNANAKPLSVIPKLRSHFKKGTSILGFVSHVDAELKVKAQDAGCDAVMPRSAFSQNLPQILRRHGADEEIEEQAQ